MHDQALIWNTDENLQVTTLTARLRDLANVGSITAPLHVSVLWGENDPFDVAVVAHYWALDGESLSFDTAVGGTLYHFDLDPLHAPDGSVCGVTGRAREIRAHGRIDRSLLREAEDVAGIGSWHEDLLGRTVTISDGLAQLLDISPDAAKLDIRSFDHPADRAQIAEALVSQRDERGYKCDHRIVCAGGRVRSVRERVRTIFDEHGIPVARVGTLTDISDLKEREAALVDLVHYDPVTGLPNRILLEERLEAMLRAQRPQSRTAVLFLDLDDFKSINDTRGHTFGDRLLACIGERLSRHVRESDLVARLGGDEFVIVVGNLNTDDAALDAARKVMRSFEDPFWLGDHAVSVGASIGIATSPTAGTSAAELMSAADGEMYAIKRNGGRGVKLFRAQATARTPEAEEKNSACLPPSSAAQRPYATRQSA